MREQSINTQLLELLDEAGMSRKGLARGVVDLGRRRGEPDLKYNHSSVTRWIRGDLPRPPIPALIASVLSARLGRQVTVADIGMAPSPIGADVGVRLAQTPAESIEEVSNLTQGDHEQQRFLSTAGWDVAIYSSAGLRWLLVPRTPMPPGRGLRSVGRDDVNKIRSAIGAFRLLDNQHGGGHFRSAIVDYLRSQVMPILRDARCTDEVRRDLFSVAAQLAQLAGWQAYDMEMHGLAQRYLVQALSLATQAGDDGLSAEILAGMSHQAVYVAQGDLAVDMAQAAQRAARRAGLRLLQTECFVMEAHAHASRTPADARMCSYALNQADVAFSQATSRASAEGPEWLRYFDAAYYAAKIAHCFRSLGRGHETKKYALQSLNMDPTYVRGRALNEAILGTGFVMTGEIDLACHHGRKAVDLAVQLKSARVHTYVRDLLRRLSAYEHTAEVTAFREYASAQLGRSPRTVGHAESR